MSNKLQYSLLFLTLLIGFALRFINLNHVPSGFFCDEASIGFNAYSLLNTGKDEYGVPFPIFFQSFGDYRLPLEVYSSIPFIGIFGLNEMSTRLPSVFYGLITIMALYFIGKEIDSKKSNSSGLLVTFIASTMPWLIHYNRTGFEFSIYVAFFTITVLLLLKTILNKSFLIPSFIIASLTLYTYQPAKLLIPLLLLGFFIINRKTYLIHKKNTIVGLLSFLIIGIPLILSFLNGQGFARFNMVSIFSTNLSFTQSVLHITQNYFIQLSPFYFVSGEPTFITRHFVGGLTPILITTLPFLLIGFIRTLFTVKNNKTSQFLIYWLFIYPIAGAVTASAPFTSRSIIGASLFAIFISLGILEFVRYFPFKKIASICIIVSLILINTFSFFKFYLIKYPQYSSDFWGWQFGAGDIVKYFVSQQSKYDELIMAPEFNAPDIFFKFYSPNNCMKCKIGLPNESYNPNLRQLFAVTPYYLNNHQEFHLVIQKSIVYPNGTIAFQIGEIVQ